MFPEAVVLVIMTLNLSSPPLMKVLEVLSEYPEDTTFAWLEVADAVRPATVRERASTDLKKQLMLYFSIQRGLGKAHKSILIYSTDRSVSHYL